MLNNKNICDWIYQKGVHRKNFISRKLIFYCYIEFLIEFHLNYNDDIALEFQDTYWEFYDQT